MTPPAIDNGTVRPVAQHLNHYATTGPYTCIYTVVKNISTHLLWYATIYNIYNMVEQVVWRKTLPPYSGNVFLHQNDGIFLFGVQSITSEKSILQGFQGVKLKS
jgi:hypothetical protein